MPRPSSFYTSEGIYKKCACSYLNGKSMKVCRRCGRRLVKRPKHKKDRSVDAKIDAAEDKLKQWSKAVTTAVHKMRYYQQRLSALRKKQLAAALQRSPDAQRAIRLRETESPK